MSSLLAEPAHSLIRQSLDSRERLAPLNGDGFGQITPGHEGHKVRPDTENFCHLDV
jgi:hypothetical protein